MTASFLPEDPHADWHDLSENFDDLFETAPYGLLTLKPSGHIYRVNAQFKKWVGNVPSGAARFSDFLTVPGRIYSETHVRPLMRLQGFFDQVAFDLTGVDGKKIPVLVNGLERRDEGGNLLFMRISVFSAADRRRYENQLLAARSAAVAGLSDEKRIGALREQFIAVLGHDLRNPLAALDGGVRMIAKTPLNEKALFLIPMMRQSVYRMAGLIDNVMDFARGRMGGGLAVDRTPIDLEPHILQVVEELRAAWPDRVIQTQLALPSLVNCDAARISQLLSNLVANALTHGAKDGAVTVGAVTEGEEVALWVANPGEPIPPSALARLFEPFTREDDAPSQQGLGLGLFIAAEIARAHQATLEATSSPEETRFTLRMPIKPMP